MTRGDLYRAAVEGIAFGTNHIFETYREIGEPPRSCWRSAAAPRTRCGCRRRPTFPACRRRVRERTIGASYGDAFLARWPSARSQKSDIRDWNPAARRVAPRAKASRRLRKAVSRVQGTLSAQQGSDGGAVMRRGAASSGSHSTSWGRCSAELTTLRSTPPARLWRRQSASVSMAAAAKLCRSKVSPCGCSISACRSRS